MSQMQLMQLIIEEIIKEEYFEKFTTWLKVLHLIRINNATEFEFIEELDSAWQR